MAELAEIEAALRAADAAGNAADARALANAYRYAKTKQAIDNDPISMGAKNFTQSMSGIDQFNAGTGLAFQNIGRGIKQLVGGDYDHSMDAADRALTHTPAGLAGNVMGNVAALAPAAVIPGAASIAGAGAIGASLGALQPTTDSGGTTERLGNMLIGGTLGAGVQGLASHPVEVGQALKNMVTKPVSGVKAVVEPLYESGRNQILARTLRDATNNRQDVIQGLRNAPELVPGSLPTAAEVGNSGGLAALQRSAAAIDPEAYATRGIQQNEARTGQLSDLAGTSGERQFHSDAREVAAKQLYDEAYAKGVDLRRDATTGQFLTKAQQAARKGEITKLMQTPAMQDAVAQAKVLAKNEMENIGDPAGSVKGLDYVKRALDDQIKNSTGNEQRILVNLKNRLLTTIDTISPAYAQARITFAEQSKPINQMDVAQNIYDRSVSPLTGQIKPEMYAKALSDDTVASVTGMRNGTLEKTMSPEQLEKLTNIREDLARSIRARDMGRGPGSDTVQKLAMSNVMRQSGLPMDVLHTPGLGRIANWIYSGSDEQMKQALSKMLLNPQETARIMSMVPPTEQMLRTPPNISSVPALAGRALLPAFLRGENQ